MNFKKFALLLIGGLSILSCKKDDNGITTVPAKDLAEVVVTDQKAIEDYLNTHFYNYEEFDNPPAGFDFKIKIDTIEGANASKKPLMDDVVAKDILLSDNDETDIKHTMYTLNVRTGSGGVNPKLSDSTYVRYSGELLNGVEFDKATTPLWFNLLGLVRGFREGMPAFKDGSTISTNPNGTFDVEGYGIGLIIMPSGLGYFSQPQGKIPAYAPLVFKIDLLKVNEADHDQDGIPSYMEDLDGDGVFLDENTDGDGSANFSDADDDGDGIPTKKEIEIAANGTISFPDKDGDGKKNYLDNDDDGDGILTRNEIIVNTNGTITYPDKDEDGTPDYLDPDN